MPSAASGQLDLVERLIDSPLEWRQLIQEANGGEYSLSRLDELQIKRQQVIHELVQTERHHCLTLALMRQVYLAGLRRLNESRTVWRAARSSSSDSGELVDLERLFPALDDLIQAHELFFAHLRLRLVDSCRQPGADGLIGLVGPLGDLLCEQFRLRSDEGDGAPSGNGHKLLRAYTKFCGHHRESSRYYKHLMQTDKGFKHFIEACNKQHASCRQRGIPECNLLVTQRLTKYPLLIEQLIKTSKDEPQEEARLREALAQCKALLAELNEQMARKESFERLLDIYAQFCPKSYTIYNRHLRFTKHDLLQHTRPRQLLHSDAEIRIWSTTRRKLVPVLCLVLDDIVVFLRAERQPAFYQPAAQVEPEPASPLQAEPGLAQLVPAPPSSQCALINVVASQVRYQFANVDNRSSVIALGKLLVREKAANEGQPRIYLISSSPRKPEMYELAFVSKRHQAAFVEKLKHCIERHSRTQLEPAGQKELLSRQLDQCLLEQSRRPTDDGQDGDDELDVSQEFRTPCGGGRRRRSQCCCSSAAYLRSQQTGPDPDEEELFVEATECRPEGARCRPEACQQAEESEFELDIEQDVVQPPPPASHSDANLSSSDEATVARSGSFLYATPTQVCPAESQPSLSEAASPAGGGRASPCCSYSEPDERPAGSNESGLSERAKDSMDESASSKQKQKQQTRAGRRRRAQRPRNVSNQSTSSSEAAHQQALQLMAGARTAPFLAEAAGRAEEEFDSGRGHDSSSSSGSLPAKGACAPAPPPDGAEQQQAAAIVAAPVPPAAKKERLLDLKLLKSSISLSSSSIGSTLMGSITGHNADKSSASSTASSSGSLTGSSVKGAGLAKCSSSAAALISATKSGCSFAKQRKLSTVSTMSSQLKLIGSQLQCAGSGHLSLCSSCREPLASGCSSQHSTMSKQVRQQIRRAAFQPEQKLEELRDLSIQFDRDKREWQAKFDKMQEQLLDERRQLDLDREQLKQERQQVAYERDQLYRKLDVLKEFGILLSPSHKVIITAPEARNYLHNHQRQPLQNLKNGQHLSSIQINASHHQQALNYNTYLHQLPQQQPVNANGQTADAQRDQQQQQHHHHHKTTNLFIESQAAKMPVHLSEANSPSSALAVGKALVGSLGGAILSAERLISPDCPKTKRVPNVESHLI